MLTRMPGAEYQMPDPAGGRLTLILAGFMQSLSLVPMSVMLLNSAGERFRGRVMGVRMLAIYGVPIGLLLAGVLIEHVGFAWTASLYCAVGLVLTGSIALYWRAHLWPHEAKQIFGEPRQLRRRLLGLSGAGFGFLRRLGDAHNRNIHLLDGGHLLLGG